MAHSEKQCICVKCPGKVILHGEHSVVYGRRAVAVSLNLTTLLHLTASESVISVSFPNIEIEEEWKIDDVKVLWDKLLSIREDGIKPTSLSESEGIEIRKFLKLESTEVSSRTLALLCFFHLYCCILPEPRCMHIHFTSDIPVGAGLGSSAAYAACLSAALLKFTGVIPLSQNSDLKKEDLDVVCQWAFCSEQIVHGTPSGIDNSICTYGGAVSFKNGIVEPLDIPTLDVLLVNTGVSRNTRKLVEGVRERHSRMPSIINPILTAMDALTEKAIYILKQLRGMKGMCDPGSLSDKSQIYNELYELIDINQALLLALGVSHFEINRIASIASSHCLHAKLTGAGGGGFCIIPLCGDVPENKVLACRMELEAAGYQVWPTKIGTPGVSLFC